MLINSSKYYAKIGMQAAERAAKKVIEQARKDNKPLPIWDGEKVQYLVPKSAHDDAADPQNFHR